MARGISAGCVFVAVLLSSGGSSAGIDLERRFDALIDTSEMGGWMKVMAAEPNHVGSAHNKANAEMVLQQFKSWGWDAHIETFDVVLSFSDPCRSKPP